MLYPYPADRSYSREISRIFGFLSILFSFYIPPTGLIMGVIGLVYEKRDAKEHNEGYSYLNLGLNAGGMVIGGLFVMYIILFRLKLF